MSEDQVKKEREEKEKEEEKDEELVPIDIHTNKLLDWLLSRRHCNAQWLKSVKDVSKKISVAIQDMPPNDEIARLLSGSYITYFHCLRIVEILKDTESATKNIFGRYSSQRMKDWQEIVRLYEKDNVYLAESAQMLIRNATYEIPSLKKQISKCQQIQEECDKKESELVKNANDLREKYRNDCKKMGIKGDDVKKEIVSLLSALPRAYDEIVSTLGQVQETRNYYLKFTKFMLDKQMDDLLPMIKFLIEKGNATTYEWVKGIKPLEVRQQPFDIVIEEEKKIDEVQSDEIDFGDDGIDWEITEDVQVIAEEIKAEEGVAEGELALSVLDNKTTRSQVLDELYQLEAFLDQRKLEIQAESHSSAFNFLQTEAANELMVSKETIASMLSSVRQIINSLSNAKMKNLQLIRTSPRYVDRVAETLRQSLVTAEKLIKRKEEVETKRQQVIKEFAELTPQLPKIVAQTKQLQSQIEADISKRYKNRPVNLMGGINAI